MGVPVPSVSAAPPARLKLYPYTLLAVVFFLALAAPFCLRKQADWDSVYLSAALHLRAGDDIFQAGYVYPPFMAWLAVPFTYLSGVPGRLAWYFVNVLATVVLVRGGWQLTGGGRLEGAGTIDRREHLIAFLGLAAGCYYVLDAFTNLQTDLVVAALVVAGCLTLQKGRPLAAACWFGVAAGMKCTPLLWAPYLAWKRQWLTAACVGAVAIAVNLLPDLTHPASECRLVKWVDCFLTPVAGRDPGAWHSAIQYNHSLSGVGNRWLIADWAWDEAGRLRAFVSPDRVATGTLKGVVYGIELLLVVVAFLIVGRHPATDTTSQLGVLPRSALEFSVVLLLMVLLSPMSSKPHFCTLVVPGFCIARLAVMQRDRVLALLLSAAIVAGLLSNQDLWGKTIYSLVIWYGSVTWNAVFLFVACLYALRNYDRRTTDFAMR